MVRVFDFRNRSGSFVPPIWKRPAAIAFFLSICALVLIIIGFATANWYETPISTIGLWMLCYRQMPGKEHFLASLVIKTMAE